MVETLSLEEKKHLFSYLYESIRKMEESVTAMTYLEERWMEIKRLMKSLDYEPYIDDQPEIDEIWNICDDLIKSGKIEESSWDFRKTILREIIEGDYFDEYGVYDPMKVLFSALCISERERISGGGFTSLRTGIDIIGQRGDLSGKPRLGQAGTEWKNSGHDFAG